MLTGRRARKLSGTPWEVRYNANDDTEGKKEYIFSTPAVPSFFFLVGKKRHTGIEILAFAIGKEKFKSKQRREILRKQLHYYSYFTVYELNSEEENIWQVKYRITASKN